MQIRTYVSVADVLDRVEEDTYQTAAAREWMLIRGERSMRCCDEPAYTLSAHKTPAFIDSDYEIGNAQKISDIDVSYRRLTVDEYLVLQGMGNFELPDVTKQTAVRLVGNAIPPELARSVAEEL